MIVLPLVAAAVCIAFIPAVVFGVRRRKKPADGLADWWPQFEADFRAYAARVDAPSEAAHRRHDPGRPPRSIN